jgi:hypothetical protein
MPAVQPKERHMPKIGEFPKNITKGSPPLILHAQVDGFVKLTTPAELKEWQDDLKTHFGITMDASNLAGIAGECCCGGCSDMCDLLA